jgi:hypothetical protein
LSLKLVQTLYSHHFIGHQYASVSTIPLYTGLFSPVEIKEHSHLAVSWVGDAVDTSMSSFSKAVYKVA